MTFLCPCDIILILKNDVTNLSTGTGSSSHHSKIKQKE